MFKSKAIYDTHKNVSHQNLHPLRKFLCNSNLKYRSFVKDEEDMKDKNNLPPSPTPDRGET
jgi:hypothetical protein